MMKTSARSDINRRNLVQALAAAIALPATALVAPREIAAYESESDDEYVLVNGWMLHRRDLEKSK